MDRLRRPPPRPRPKSSDSAGAALPVAGQRLGALQHAYSGQKLRRPVMECRASQSIVESRVVLGRRDFQLACWPADSGWPQFGQRLMLRETSLPHWRQRRGRVSENRFRSDPECSDPASAERPTVDLLFILLRPPWASRRSGPRLRRNSSPVRETSARVRNITARGIGIKSDRRRRAQPDGVARGGRRARRTAPRSGS